MARSKRLPPASSGSGESVDDHSGSFGAGLFLGVVAGSFGMFLFGTPQGQDLLQSLKKELEQSADSNDVPERAQKLIASLKKSVEDKIDSAQKADEFPKFKRRLAE